MKIDFTKGAWLLLAAGGIVLATAVSLLFHLNLSFTAEPLKIFFSNPVQQWYYNRTTLTIALAFGCAILVSVFFYRSNYIPLFILTLGLLELAFFVFVFERYFRPRYVITIQIWYVIVLAIGIYSIWLILNAYLRKRNALLISTVLIAATFNTGQVLFPSLNNISMPMPITGEYHGDAKTASDFLLGKVKAGDVLISTYYYSYAYFLGKPIFSKIYSDHYHAQSLDYITSIIKQYDNGWIVMDDGEGIASSKLTLETFTVNNKKVEYLGGFGNQYIWKWYITK